MRRVCIYHAGCPDGFGAAWAAWRAWGGEADYIARGHEDPLRPASFEDALVVFADIAPPVALVRPLADAAGHLVVLDHHLSAMDQYKAEPGLVDGLRGSGHQIVFELGQSGAALSWHHFHPDDELPELLAYVRDQDLWSWKLPHSREVNAAIGSYPRAFDAWQAMAARPIAELVAEGTSLVRAQDIEVERSLHGAHPVSLGTLRVEAVNAREHRSLIGHELATRARFGTPCGAVYRLTGTRVDVSIYSTGDYDVAAIARQLGGGGHRNASGFSVTLEEWLAKFV